MKRLGIVASLALALIAGAILWRNLTAHDLQQALYGLRAYPLPLLLGALLLSGLSFTVAGAFEAVALREIGQPLGLARPMLTSWIAYPVGHVMAFATLGAGAIRLRLYSAWGLDPARIGRMVLLTALPYAIGVTLLLSLSLLVAQEEAAKALQLPRSLVISGGIAGLLACTAYLLIVARGSIAVLPSRLVTVWQVVCGTLEIVLVAAVLFLFLPAAAGITWFHFLPLYLIGVLAGQLSSVPAGLGVLEASLLLMFPQIPKDQLIAAVMAYRVMFEVLPLAVGLMLLASYETLSHRGVIGRWWRAAESRSE